MGIINLLVIEGDLQPDLLYTYNDNDTLNLVLLNSYGDNFFSKLYYDLSLFNNINTDYGQLIINDLLYTTKLNIETTIKVNQ